MRIVVAVGDVTLLDQVRNAMCTYEYFLLPPHIDTLVDVCIVLVSFLIVRIKLEDRHSRFRPTKMIDTGQIEGLLSTFKTLHHPNLHMYR